MRSAFAAYHMLIIPMLGLGVAIQGAVVGLAFGLILLLLGRVRSADRMTIGIGTVLAGTVGFGTPVAKDECPRFG